jgi:G:T-mismatch repair DNA endonuclease (very short patch repair protein)
MKQNASDIRKTEFWTNKIEKNVKKLSLSGKILTKNLNFRDFH